jgi:hypothetical protein
VIPIAKTVIAERRRDPGGGASADHRSVAAAPLWVILKPQKRGLIEGFS